MQDFGGPGRLPPRETAARPGLFLVVQNANAYEEGLPDSFLDPGSATLERAAQQPRTIRDAAMSDDAPGMERRSTGPGTKAALAPIAGSLQRALLDAPWKPRRSWSISYDYRTNLAHYPAWQVTSANQPPTLVVWGEHDVIFPASARHPSAGHQEHRLQPVRCRARRFEDHADKIAAHIRRSAANL